MLLQEKYESTKQKLAKVVDECGTKQSTHERDKALLEQQSTFQAKRIEELIRQVDS